MKGARRAPGGRGGWGWGDGGLGGWRALGHIPAWPRASREGEEQKGRGSVPLPLPHLHPPAFSVLPSAGGPRGAHGHASPPMGLRAEQCRSSQRTVPNQGLPAAPHPPAPPTHIPLCHGSTRRGGGGRGGGDHGVSGVGRCGGWGVMGGYGGTDQNQALVKQPRFQ